MPARTPTYDYVAVGHVTVDLIADRTPAAAGGDDGVQRDAGAAAPVEQVGGGAFYSALQAARLGCRALIVTRGEPARVHGLLEPYREELDVVVSASDATTRLLTSGRGSRRRQRVQAWAGPIERLPALDASIVHYAPVARETPPRAPAGASFVGLTPQGLIRTWGHDGWVHATPLDPALLPARVDAVVFSRAERESCRALLEPEGVQALVAITSGAKPTELRLPGGARAWAKAMSVEDPQDDLGAGDVFAATLFVELWRGSSAVEAARRASAAAAVRLAGVGPGAVGDSEAIAEMLGEEP